MLHVPVGANTFGLSTPSWGTTRPAAANGTSVTPSTTGYGTYASVITALASDCFGLLININSNSGSAASRETVVKIGVDMSGGTSYVDLITDLLAGGAATYSTSGGGLWFFFPLNLPAGSRLAAAAYSTVTTALRVGIVPMMRPPNPALIRKASYVETIGASGRVGTSVTAGTTTEGAWKLLGATSRRCWWWQLAIQVPASDTSWNAAVLHADLAVGNGTNYDIIIQDAAISTATTEAMTNPPLTAGVEWDVPAGSNIYMRLQSSGTLDTYTGCAYGAGG